MDYKDDYRKLNLLARCQDEVRRQSMAAGQGHKILMADDIRQFIDADVEGLDVPDAWVKLLALANCSEAEMKATPAHLDESEFASLQDWVDLNVSPVSYLRAVQAAESETPRTQEAAAKTENGKVLFLQKNWIPTAFAAGLAILALGAAGGYFAGSKPPSSDAALVAENEGLEQRVDDLKKENLDLVKQNKIGAEALDLVAANAKVMEKDLSASRERLARVERELQGKQDLVQTIAMLRQQLSSRPDVFLGLTVDFEAGVKPSHQMAGISDLENFSPRFTAVREDRPTFRWKFDSQYPVTIQIMKSGSQTALWNSKELPGGTIEFRSETALERGVFYEWVVLTKDPRIESRRVPFYVLSKLEHQNLGRELKGSLGLTQEAAILERYKLYQELIQFGGRIEEEARRKMRELARK